MCVSILLAEFIAHHLELNLMWKILVRTFSWDLLVNASGVIMFRICHQMGLFHSKMELVMSL